jgi:hypothetical protein
MPGTRSPAPGRPPSRGAHRRRGHRPVGTPAAGACCAGYAAAQRRISITRARGRARSRGATISDCSEDDTSLTTPAPNPICLTCRCTGFGDPRIPGHQRLVSSRPTSRSRSRPASSRSGTAQSDDVSPGKGPSTGETSTRSGEIQAGPSSVLKHHPGSEQTPAAPFEPSKGVICKCPAETLCYASCLGGSNKRVQKLKVRETMVAGG